MRACRGQRLPLLSANLLAQDTALSDRPDLCSVCLRPPIHGAEAAWQAFTDILECCSLQSVIKNADHRRRGTIRNANGIATSE